MGSILMHTQPTLTLVGDNRRPEDKTVATEKSALLVHSHSDPTPTKGEKFLADQFDEVADEEAQDILCDPIGSSSRSTHAQIIDALKLGAAFDSSPTTSRPNSPFSTRPSLPSSGTSASIFNVDVHSEDRVAEASAVSSRRPSILSRLRSSISTTSGLNQRHQRPDVQPSDFRRPPECPEKHFIDSVGMIIPGVCNRNQCSLPLSHFVINWRLCEPIEYTTALADHGISYTDYCRLLNALSKFVDDIPNEPKLGGKTFGRWWSHEDPDARLQLRVDCGEKDLGGKRQQKRRNSIEPIEQLIKSEGQASKLNTLLADITFHWRARGVPIMVCVGSFSLFVPNRISESHIQILHVALESQDPPSGGRHGGPGQRLSFVDPSSLLIKTLDFGDHCISMPRDKSGQRSQSPPHIFGNISHHHHVQIRDRTRPWPLWPNAIPTRKRDLINGHANRYGADPYFRAWMRANVNSRTQSTSYAKYMIEQEDDPFINKRLEYATMPSKRALLWGLLTKGYRRWKEDCPSVVNRDYYDHNRRVECRKTVEHGSRLRLTRFAFRRPLYPPHTPEMDELGLTQESYNKIIADIDGFRMNVKVSTRDRTPGLAILSSLPWKLFHRRCADDALAKVSEYIRQVNAEQRKVVWTIEKIPGVYAKKIGRNEKEWEISVWNGEDPLELLLQLEKWGIIEKRLDIDDDD